MRLLIVATHPIQYQAPLFRALANVPDLELVVGYLDLPDPARLGVGFGIPVAWDVALTEGYGWRRLNARVRAGPASHGFRGRRWVGARREMARIDADAVLVMGWNQIGLLQAWLAAKSLGVPLIVRGDSNARRRRPWWKRLAHRALLALPDRFLAVGESNAQFYREAGVDPGAIVLAPHCVDNAYFARAAAAVDRQAQRGHWGIAADDCCVLYAGKFEPVKRIADLIAAAAQLDAGLRARTVLLLVGAGPLEAALRAQARNAGVRCVWAGFMNQSQIARAYVASDMLVLPSEHETWGLVVNEAMACGRPAIVSDRVGCAYDLVRPGETGLVYPMGEVAALAGALDELAGDPQRRAALGAAARDRVASAYTIERSVAAILALLRACRARVGSPHAATGGRR